MINIIVAISENMAIGRGGDMPWHIAGDMRFFKRTTMGHAVVMGRRTWESIGCRPLPGRRNIVISRSMPQGPQENESRRYEVASSLEEAIALVRSVAGDSAECDEEIFVMGGGQVYREAMKMADRLYITHVHAVIEDADTFFPEISSEEWTPLERSDVEKDEKSGMEYQFVTYGRR